MEKKIYPDCRDTVSSLGAVLEKSLPATTANPNVRTFRHALSLDERRSQFQAQFWKEKQTDFLHHDGGNHYTKTDVEEVWFAVRAFDFEILTVTLIYFIIRDVMPVRLYSLFVLSS